MSLTSYRAAPPRSQEPGTEYRAKEWNAIQNAGLSGLTAAGDFRRLAAVPP
jgi:hypothetical protein